MNDFNKNKFGYSHENKWNKSKFEQIFLKCSLTVKRLNNILNDFLNHERKEQLITTEIEAFIQKNIAYNKQTVEDWCKRYNDEIEMYKIKSQILSDDIVKKQEILSELEATYEDRQTFIDKYIREKELNRMQRAHEEYRQNCAIKIQSWWRGMMVRKKLGPYRLDDKKKKRPNKLKK